MSCVGKNHKNPTFLTYYYSILEMYRYQNLNRYWYPIPILNFKPKPIVDRYRYLNFSVLKLLIYTPFDSKGDTSRTGHT